MRAGSNWRHLNGLSLGMMGNPVRCLPKVVHPDVAALKVQHNQVECVKLLAPVRSRGLNACTWSTGAKLGRHDLRE